MRCRMCRTASALSEPTRDCCEIGLNSTAPHAISAGYLIAALASAPRGTLVVIDYLQLLDQKRDLPGPWMTQVKALKAFASEQGS